MGGKQDLGWLSGQAEREPLLGDGESRHPEIRISSLPPEPVGERRRALFVLPKEAKKRGGGGRGERASDRT
jgi:hypothetical protein